MNKDAIIWLIVFFLLGSGLFLYLRGNLDPNGKSYHPNNHTCKNYRIIGLSMLLIAIVCAFWLYTREPKIHIYLAE